MRQLSSNVYTETEIRGCDPSIVLTREGAVFIDTADRKSTRLNSSH